MGGWMSGWRMTIHPKVEQPVRRQCNEFVTNSVAHASEPDFGADAG